MLKLRPLIVKTVFKNVIKKHGTFFKKVECGGRNKLLQHQVGFKINQILFDVSVFFSLATLFAMSQDSDMTTFENKIKHKETKRLT